MEPDPYSRIDPVTSEKKEEPSEPTHRHAPPSDLVSRDSSSALPSVFSLKRPRSCSPLTPPSDDEMDEKTETGGRAAKRVRRRREIFIPLWQLEPLVFEPNNSSDSEEMPGMCVSSFARSYLNGS